ncbi:hypothetical protein ACVWZM_007622 [Bradyrhizobium sp. USDA 4501]
MENDRVSAAVRGTSSPKATRLTSRPPRLAAAGSSSASAGVFVERTSCVISATRPARNFCVSVIEGESNENDGHRRERDADQFREREEAHELRSDAARHQPLRPSHHICSTAGVKR